MGRAAASWVGWGGRSKPCRAFCRACLTSIDWKPAISVRRKATSRSTRCLTPWRRISSDRLRKRGCDGAWCVRSCWSAATGTCSRQCCAICCRMRYDTRTADQFSWAAGARVTISGSRSGIAASASRSSNWVSYFRSTTRARRAPSAAASDWVWLSSDASGKCWSTGSTCAPRRARAPCSGSRCRAEMQTKLLLHEPGLRRGRGVTFPASFSSWKTRRACAPR